MGYWVYENWRARGHKAVIHKDSCPFCNDGHGLKGGTSPENGKWHGPFTTLQTAMSMALSIKGSYVKKHECVK